MTELRLGSTITKVFLNVFGIVCVYFTLKQKAEITPTGACCILWTAEL